MSRNEPQPFGRYALLRRIGAGGMGEVFLAKEARPEGGERVVVVKKILPHLSEDKGFVGRFADEGKVVVHLQHVNIAQVLEMGEVDGNLFMAMEYVDGKTLAKVESRLRERNYSFPLELALWIGAEACRGLGYAHKRRDENNVPLQVVHRDVSPANVMVSYDGQVKIIDFGAALSTLKEELTAPRVVIGNLSYMAPEHARKQHVDARADIFSIGVVLWELIAWQMVPSDGDPIERWRRAARPSFKPPSHYRPELDPQIDAIVMKALALDPRDRYDDAEQMRTELLVALSTLAPGTDGRRLGAFMRSLFDAERAAERAIIDEALVPEGPTTGRLTDPAGLDQPEATMKSMDRPVLTGDVTTPAMPALVVSGETLASSEFTHVKVTAPDRPPLRGLSSEVEIERTLPGRSLALDEPNTVSTRSDPKLPGRPMQRTPSKWKQAQRTPWLWVLIGAAAGALVVGLLLAILD